MIASQLLLVIFQLLLTLLMFISINSLRSISKGYVTIDHLLSTSNLGYNLFYRILSPPVFITFTTLILYKIGLPDLTRNIWVVSVYYFLFNLLIIILMRRFSLMNKYLYFVIFIISVWLSFWIYSYMLQYGVDAILPEAGNFRTEWWFIILIYFYSLLNSYSPNYTAENQRKDKFILNRLNVLIKNYEEFLQPKFKLNNFLKTLFFSIMITEDINRPPVLRFMERLFFFTRRVKTTGIMQVTNSKSLTDKESIELAQKIILSFYRNHSKKTVDNYELVRKIASDYNSSGYGYEIVQNYLVLKRLLPNNI